MRRKTKRLLSLTLASAISLSMVAFSASYAEEGEAAEPTLAENNYTSIYEKPDISELTGDGYELAEINGTSSVLGQEKEWYEYIVYSATPVSSVRVSSTRRLIFYDPFNYSEAMVMEVEADDTAKWGTQNSLSISYTQSQTLSYGYSETNSTTSSVQVSENHTINGSSTASLSESVSEDITLSSTKSTTKEKSKKRSDTDCLEIGFTEKVEAGTLIAKTEVDFSQVGKESTTKEISEREAETTSVTGTAKAGISVSAGASATSGWSDVIGRVCTSSGTSSQQVTHNISTTKSKTVTTTFQAAYFNAAGAPLPWTIVHYKVMMPMKVELQADIYGDGNWITTDSTYCLLTTIEGTCREYMKNNVVYIEHWGTGEPVVETEFWGQFFTKSQLKTAYQEKLYPES